MTSSERLGDGSEKDKIALYAMFSTGGTPNYVHKLTDLPIDYIEKYYESWQKTQRKYKK